MSWCEHRRIFIQAVRVPGLLKSVDESRSRQDSALSPPEVALSASAWNAQLTIFVSWWTQPGDFAVNTFSLYWCQFWGFAFPTFYLISKRLTELKREIGAYFSHTSLNRSALVTSPSEFGVRRSDLCTPLKQRPTTSRVEIIRESFSKQGFSSKVVDLLLVGNRETTISCYQSAWLNWLDWCSRRHSDPLSNNSNKSTRASLGIFVLACDSG